MAVSDSGSGQNNIILDSFGQTVSTMMTISVTARKGRLTWRNRDNIIFLNGTGLYDRAVIIRTDLNSLNARIGGILGIDSEKYEIDDRANDLVYSCFFADGCRAGDADQIFFDIDYKGFFGSGGSLNVNKTITVHFN